MQHFVTIITHIHFKLVCGVWCMFCVDAFLRYFVFVIDIRWHLCSRGHNNISYRWHLCYVFFVLICGWFCLVSASFFCQFNWIYLRIYFNRIRIITTFICICTHRTKNLDFRIRPKTTIKQLISSARCFPCIFSSSKANCSTICKNFQ